MPDTVTDTNAAPAAAHTQRPHAAAGAVDWNQRAGPLFKFGLAVGFALIALGMVAIKLVLLNSVVAILVICAGLGIILGAFGSVVTISIPIQSVTVVGVAGITVFLFSMLLDRLAERYVRVTIGGDIVDAQVEFVGDRNYLGAFQKSEHFYDFIIFGSEIKRPYLSLYITTADKREFLFECISRDAISPQLASGSTLSWRFYKEKGILINSMDNKRIADIGQCREAAAQQASWVQSGLALLTAWLPAAYAQPAGSAKPQAQNRSYSPYFEQFTSGTSHVRRSARTSLAEEGLPAVEPLLSNFAEGHDNYQTRLGTVVTLTEMIRKNKSMRPEIIGRLSEDDIRRLTDAVADEDKTIRVYASEFLYELGDPRTIDAVQRIYHHASEDGRYNLLLVLKGAIPYSNAMQKREAALFASRIRAEAPPRTSALAQSVADMAR
ncbi:hypothetical protein GCM10027277_22120 [Pseudoduganella ginsengisoli]|uniref:HEAT repeat domain-containing protein n=1 Tax=Pseudoduganella ginsengisoli TaxID=1462440 RepID=A0A6L6PSU9_9BURK|nr:hypothetical protein [Pseudoduganella ginsengisoli]MTW00535.1 hypothetical protein [Pseudoduganella ginsengisoli]